MDPIAATELGRTIVDANAYMVVATAGDDGYPWASPVYFAHVAYREVVWVSKPQARHSRNLAARPEVSIVIFDSSVPIGSGRAVYMKATAAETDAHRAPGLLAAYSERSVGHGGASWRADDLTAPARLRLYRAVASGQWVLDERDERIPVNLGRDG